MGRDFKDRLKDARIAKAARRGDDVRPADVARALGIARSAYQQWESGKTRPRNLDTYKRLAAYLGVDLLKLIDADPKAKGQPVTKGRKDAKEA